MRDHFSLTFHGDTDASSQTRHRRRLFVELGPKPGMRILDVGCGSGLAALEFAQFEDVYIVGVGPDATEIAKANALSVKQGLADRVRFVHAELDWPILQKLFGRNSFDGIYCLETLKSSSSFQDAYRNLAALLRMGGKLAAYEWCWTPSFDPENPDHVRLAELIETSAGIGHRHVEDRTVGAAVQALEESGLSVIVCQDLASSNPAATIPWYEQLQSSQHGHRSWSGSIWKKDEIVGGLSRNSAQFLSEAGRLQIFSPMVMVVSERMRAPQ